MSTLEETLPLSAPGHLRPLDAGRDLFQVADLIELCFSRTMDADGREYLRHMRRAAQEASALRWATGLSSQPGMPVSGYVWVEQNRVVGNLSLIPLTRQGRRVYLIANVAVHPDHRRKGIGRMLTQAALDYARAQRAQAAWLQVRDDNPGAYDLYRSLGFQERARRATWLGNPIGPSRVTLPTSVTVTPRFAGDWRLQRDWLNRAYPVEVAWNLPFTANTYRPGLITGLLRFLYNFPLHQWAARKDGRLLGVLTWEPSRSFADNLWLATDPSRPEDEALAIQALLPYGLAHTPGYRPVSLNYPQGRAEDAILSAGFNLHQVLVWMEVPYQD